MYDGGRSFEELKSYVEIKVAEHAVLSTATTIKSETAEEVPVESTMPEDDLVKTYSNVYGMFQNWVLCLEPICKNLNCILGNLCASQFQPRASPPRVNPQANPGHLHTYTYIHNLFGKEGFKKRSRGLMWTYYLK